MSRWLLRSRNVLVEGTLQPAGLMVDGEKIEAVVPYESLPVGVPVTDVRDLTVLPGLVDAHVHINEPGRTEWEGFETATRAALAGGITTLVDMPLNCIPVTTSLWALELKRREVTGKLSVDCGFYGGVIPGNAHELEPMIAAGVLGFKCFLCPSGIDEFPNVMEEDLREAMPILASRGVPLLVHAEQESCVAPSGGESRRYQTYLDSRPAQWERDAIAMMIRLSAETRCPVHIVHLSNAGALDLIAEARANGIPITVETCPHYLTLAAEAIADGQTQFKCAPPIREAANQEALWQGLLEGSIDFVVSDHSPCTPDLKCTETGDFMAAWGGISSVQFGLGLMWRECQRRDIPLSKLVEWLAVRPAQQIGLAGQKGRLAAGYDADILIWSPETVGQITAEGIHHRHKITPYLAQETLGRVEAVYLRGQKVLDSGRFEGSPSGQPLQGEFNRAREVIG